MNIFAVSHDPAECAAELDDRRLAKNIPDVGALVSNAIRSMAPNETGLCRAMHTLHPCNIWLKEQQNISWAIRLVFAMNLEFTNRHGKDHRFFDDRRIDLFKSYYFPNADQKAWVNVIFLRIPIAFMRLSRSI